MFQTFRGTEDKDSPPIIRTKNVISNQCGGKNKV